MILITNGKTMINIYIVSNISMILSLSYLFMIGGKKILGIESCQIRVESSIKFDKS